MVRQTNTDSDLAKLSGATATTFHVEETQLGECASAKMQLHLDTFPQLALDADTLKRMAEPAMADELLWLLWIYGMLQESTSFGCQCRYKPVNVNAG